MKDRLAQFWTDYREDALLALGVALISFIAFGLGRATAPQLPKTAITIEELPLTANISSGVGESEESGVLGSFVASKNGKRYYLPNCSGVTRIKPENLIGFATEEEARASGYTPAKNCPGLAGE